MADEKKTYLINIESNLAKYAQEAAEAKKRVDELKASNELLKQSGTASAAEIESNNAALKNSQKEYKQAQKMVELQTAANKSEVGSRKQLGEILALQMQALGKLGNAYTKDAQGIMRLNPLYVEQRNRIKETKQAILDYDKALNDGRSNVGRYGEAVKGAFDQAASSVLGFTTVAGAAVLAVNKLKEAFAGTEAGTKFFNQASLQFKMFFENIVSGNWSYAFGNKLAKDAKFIADSLDEIRLGDRKDLVKIAELETAIIKLRIKSVDTTKNNKEQLGFMIQAQEKENELIDYKIKDKQHELEITNLALKSQTTNTELLDKQAQLEAEILNIKGEQSLRIATRINSLIDIQDKNRLKSWREYEDTVLLGLTNEFNIRQQQLWDERSIELIEAEKQGRTLEHINRKYALLQLKFDREVNEAKLKAYGDFFGAAKGLFKEHTVMAKGLATAEAIINTYLGATKALDYPFPINIIAFATTLVTGLAAVAKIIGVDTNAESSSPSMPTAITSSQPARNITVNQVQSSILTNPQLSQSQLNSLPQNMLSASDIAREMSKMPQPVVIATIEDINAKADQVNKIKIRANI